MDARMRTSKGQRELEVGERGGEEGAERQRERARAREREPGRVACPDLA
jgi:hypothetical protein